MQLIFWFISIAKNPIRPSHKAN